MPCTRTEQRHPRLPPPPPCPLQSTFLEVQGVVNSPNSLTEESCCPFGDSFGELARLAVSTGGWRRQPPPPKACSSPALTSPTYLQRPASSLLTLPRCPLPAAAPADLANYTELCKLANSPAYRQMFLP